VRPHAVSTAGSNTYLYDNNGNLTSWAGRTLTWDYENRPTSITSGGVTTTMVYDGDGGRVKKIAGTLTVRYIGKLYECDNATCVRYIFAGSQRIAVKQVTSGAVDYYHQDHLGSSSVITTSAGVVEENLAYYPFGATRVDTHSPADVPFKYTGQELDSSTGLYIYGARYYDATLSRFISADTIVPSAADPQALNRYSYVNNNPLRYTDPSGHGFLGSIGKFFSNSVGRAVGWAVAPMLMQYMDPATQRYAIAGTAVMAGSVVAGPVGAWAGGGPLGGFVGGAVGGAATGLTSATLNTAFGQHVDFGREIWFSAASQGVLSGLGSLSTEWNFIHRAAAFGVAGGTLSELRGGSFLAGFEAAVLNRLASDAFELTKVWTDAHSDATGKDMLGNKPTGGASPCNVDGRCKGIWSYLGGYLGPEGESQGVWAAIKDLVSKPHDFTLFWNTEGIYNIDRGSFFLNSLVETYSVVTVAPSAAFAVGGIAASIDKNAVFSVDYATKRSRHK
jgi:RHS repeat-associated protein